MHAIALLTSNTHWPAFHALPESIQTFCKASTIALPMLAIAAAAYVAPITLLIGSASACWLSAEAVRFAFSGKMDQQEHTIKMIVGAVLITGITLGGLMLGLTPVCFSLMLTAFKASSLGAVMSQLVWGSFCLTSLWGIGGWLTLEVFKNINTLSLEKFTTYFKDLKEERCTRKPEENKSYDDFLFLAFRRIYIATMDKFDTVAPDSILYLSTADELKAHNQLICNEIIEDASQYAVDIGEVQQEIILEKISSNLEKLSRNLNRLDENTQREEYLRLLDLLSNLKNIPECQEIWQEFADPFQWHLTHLLQHYLSEEPEVKALTFQTTIESVEEALKAEKLPPTISETFEETRNAMQALAQSTRQLKQFFPDQENLEILDDKLTKLILKSVEITKKLCQLNNAKIADKIKIDRTEAVWDFIISNPYINTTEVIKKLKLLLNISEDKDIDQKMIDIGLGTISDLFSKGIITEKEYSDRALVQEKVFKWIEEQQEHKVNVTEVVLKTCFRTALAVSVIAPLFISPALAIGGAVLGTIAFGAIALNQNEALSFDEMWKWLGHRNRKIFAMLMTLLAYRTIGGTDKTTQSDTLKFLDKDFLGKMCMLALEFSRALFLVNISKITAVGAIIIPSLGALAAREAVEPLFTLYKRFQDQDSKQKMEAKAAAISEQPSPRALQQ